MLKKFQIRHESVFLFIIFNLISALTYWRLIFHFYEQDEWLGVGHIFSMGIGRVFEKGIWQALLFGEGRPIPGLINYIFFTLSPFNTVPFAIFAIAMHGISSFLVYKLLLKLEIKKWYAFACTLIFMINATASQAVTWFSAANSVPISVSLLILSILSIFVYFKQYNRVYLFLSYFLYYLSFITKEDNILFFIFFIFLFYSNARQKTVSIKKILILSFPYTAIFILTIIRYVFYFYSGEQAGLIVSSDQGGIVRLLGNMFFYRLETFSQFFIPYQYIFSLSERASTAIIGPDVSNIIIYRYTSTAISVLLTLIGVFVLYLLFFKRLVIKYVFYVGFLFYYLAVVPYIIINKGDSYLESRYYYLPLVGAVILLGSITVNRIRYKAIYLLIVVSYISCQYIEIQSILKNKMSISHERKYIVAELLKTNLENRKQTLIYVESDAHYLLENQTLPFQQGIGYMLMTLYYPQGVIPKNFLHEDFLWDMSTEGYITDGEYGFGYFYSRKSFDEQNRRIVGDKNIIVIRYINGTIDIKNN